MILLFKGLVQQNNIFSHLSPVISSYADSFGIIGMGISLEGHIRVDQPFKGNFGVFISQSNPFCTKRALIVEKQQEKIFQPRI